MFSYKIIRAQRRSVCITIERGGKIVVRAPLYAKVDDIENFVNSKATWIENCINKEKSKIEPPDFLGGEEFSFCGTAGCRVVFSNKPLSSFDIEAKTFYLSAVKCSDYNAAFYEFKKLAKKRFLTYVDFRTKKIAEICDFKCGKISIGSARTRWGVCSATNDITYTLYLSFLPSDLIDYVILHELCHVKQKNHSVNFWSLLLSYMPDGKIRRKKLHDYSLFLDI